MPMSNDEIQMDRGVRANMRNVHHTLLPTPRSLDEAGLPGDTGWSQKDATALEAFFIGVLTGVLTVLVMFTIWGTLV